MLEFLILGLIYFQVFRLDGVVKIQDKGITYEEADIPSDLEEYFDHYSDCYKRCLLLESSLSSLEAATGVSYFPAIIGRRPTSALNDTPCLRGKENVSTAVTSPPVVSSAAITY